MTLSVFVSYSQRRLLPAYIRSFVEPAVHFKDSVIQLDVLRVLRWLVWFLEIKGKILQNHDGGT
jgi:hypothetical protein